MEPPCAQPPPNLVSLQEAAGKEEPPGTCRAWGWQWGLLSPPASLPSSSDSSCSLSKQSTQGQDEAAAGWTGQVGGELWEVVG